ncbi:hypothetical protein BUALT_Bualt07G0135600 [Buddleja alternifolia]|uniref:ABC transporter domain-containing protein n=1 Tax=Buddleja alternifolia TaxID=168488 RepID=A0AAV6XL79_9LAMI|nr:hypothetical protein BUALT_Bualt07G0135600 [Buddleja alternifolia]
MFGFLDGEYQMPKPTIIDGTTTDGPKEVPNKAFISWRRSDRLLRGWITGKIISDKNKSYWMLQGLGPRYESFVTTMMKPPVPSYNEIIQLLQSFEARYHFHNPDNSPLVSFYAHKTNGGSYKKKENGSNHFNSKGKGFYSNGNRNSGTSNFNAGFGRDESKNQSGQTRASKPQDGKVSCQICGRNNHTALECYHRFNHAYQAKDIPQALAALNIEHVPDLEWFPDTGATAHMTGNSGKLENLRLYKGFDAVMVGNGEFMNITHVGDTQVNYDGHEIPLRNVLLVPNIKKNLLSVSQLTTDMPYEFEFDGNGFVIRDRSTKQVIANGRKKGGLYALSEGHAALFSSKFRRTNKEGWHQRLGHPSYRVINFLCSQKLIDFSDDKVSSICDSCQMGKSCRLPFMPSDDECDKPFMKVHCDLWGPAPVASTENFRYYVIFVDGFTRFTCKTSYSSEITTYNEWLNLVEPNHFQDTGTNGHTSSLRNFSNFEHGEDGFNVENITQNTNANAVNAEDIENAEIPAEMPAAHAENAENDAFHAENDAENSDVHVENAVTHAENDAVHAENAENDAVHAENHAENVVVHVENVVTNAENAATITQKHTMVTSKKDQQQYWIRQDERYRFVTVDRFFEAFQSFHVGKRLKHNLESPFDKSKSHPAALTTRKYGAKTKELLKACYSRELLLMKRNSFVYFFKISQIIVMAFVCMTHFFRTTMHRRNIEDGFIFHGALFYATTLVMFNGLAEVSMTIYKLPVFYKQRDSLFFPAWVYSIPTWILKIPISFVEVGVWVFITYYVIGFDPNVGRLFKQYMLLVVLNQMAGGLFRLIRAICRNMIIANTLGSYVLFILFALGGIVLSRDQVKKWWIWGFWSSPSMYAQSAIVVNEFRGHSWSSVIPYTNETLGVLALKSRGFLPEAKMYWIGVVALFGFTILFNVCNMVALTILNPIGKAQAFIPEESESNQRDDETGGRSRVDAITETSEHSKRGMEMKDKGFLEDKLVLLKGVTGAFRPGILTALMGVSGAGKTTLMDVLAVRKIGGYIDGNITISGYPRKQETFARISGYCEQNDIHSPHVTVHESLLYSAWLRMAPEVDVKTRKMFVDEVMELVELTPLRGSLVGLPGVNGLSTEQRKRLTIAVELVSNPSIIFMDEPTSGLDARAVVIVMRAVRNTVDTGRTFVCTIHQPSIDIFDSFDELLLLKRGGEEIYVGPLGRHSCHLIKYFEDIEGVSKIKDGYNPATWMLEVIVSAQEMVLGVDFAEVYKNSELYRRNKALVNELSRPSPETKELYFPSQYSQPFHVQCIACLWKQYWSYWRNPPYTLVRFLFVALLGLTFGSMFWDLGSKRRNVEDILNAVGAMYVSIFLGILNALAVQPVVAIERTVFNRERAAGMYSSMTYAFAQVAIEFPYVLAQAVVYGLAIYAMIGFEWTATKFFWYIFIMYFTLLCLTFYGLMTLAVSPNHHIASVISASFFALWNLFSGFIIPRPRIPIWWRWYYWASPLAWTLYGLTVSQFGDVEEYITPEQTVKEFLRSYFGFRDEILELLQR